MTTPWVRKRVLQKLSRTANSTSFMPDAFEKRKKLAKGSAKANGITEKIMKDMALDDQAFRFSEACGVH